MIKCCKNLIYLCHFVGLFLSTRNHYEYYNICSFKIRIFAAILIIYLFRSLYLPQNSENPKQVLITIMEIS